MSLITGHLGVSPTIERTGGRRGWAGDSPLIRLDCAKIRALGWKPSLTIEQAIVLTLEWLERNPYALLEEATTG